MNTTAEILASSTVEECSTDYYPEAEEDFYFETETDEEEYFESFLQSDSEEDEESDVEEDEQSHLKQKVVVRRDLNEYMEPNGQCRLLLVSLLDNFCSLYDRNPAKNQKLFSLLCRKLYSMGILKSLDFMEESRALRSIYKEAFKAIVLDAVKAAEIGVGVGVGSTVSNNTTGSGSSSVTSSPTKSLKGASASNSLSKSLSTLFLNSDGATTATATSSEPPFTINNNNNHSHDTTNNSTSAVSAEDIFMAGHSRYREDFIEGRVLGRGGYGKVVLAENILDGTSYAIKKIQFAGLSSQRYIRILREVKSLARLDHAHIVRYHSAWMEDHAVILELVEEESNGVAGGSNSNTENENGNIASPYPTSNPTATVHKHARSKSTPLVHSHQANHAHGHAHGHAHSTSLYHLQDRKIMYIQMELCLFTLDYYLKHRNAFYYAMATEARKLGHLPLGRELILRVKTDRTLNLPAEQLFYWNAETGSLHLRAGELDRIFKGIVKGLHYIHEHGMIHRDLKPMNIFFQLADEDELLPKIGDFGFGVGEGKRGASFPVILCFYFSQ